MKMKQLMQRRLLPMLLTALIFVSVLLPTLSLTSSAAVVTTPATGYTQASDVVYKSFSSGNYKGVMNWGARGEDCVFLSPHALEFYVGEYTYETLSLLDGGSQSTAPSSELYLALKAMMVAEHSHIISYQNTRDLYAYTDCVSNNSSQLVSFYSGVLHSSKWDAGSTWNREHVWPNSKCIGDKAQDAADIMMLRPTLVKENGSRGNTAYGESGSFFDPGESVRGDCARIVLYVYTRWGNTSKMWGSSGVIENLDVLLRWMEEDPVDTWEMGRNDACESILGVRNVFVDYPEYAFLLFNREIPADMVTPSGIAQSGQTTPPETEKPADTVEPADTEALGDGESAVTLPETSRETDPISTETEFEMVQPDPLPETEFEMVQPEPPAGTTSVTDTEAPVDNAGGCASATGGAVMLIMICVPPALLPVATRRRRE